MWPRNTILVVSASVRLRRLLAWLPSALTLGIIYMTVIYIIPLTLSTPPLNSIWKSPSKCNSMPLISIRVMAPLYGPFRTMKVEGIDKHRRERKQVSKARTT